jgi:proteic killer suppression protein
MKMLHRGGIAKIQALDTYNAIRYNTEVIGNFNCKETAKIWHGTISTRLPGDIQDIARRKLRILNNAKCLQDLRIPPNNRLEALKGDREGQYSIRINRQWRICFRWSQGHVYDVEMVDYH